MFTNKNITLVFLALSMLTACTKNEIECDLIPARVIRYNCDRVIFQLQTAELIGDSNWQDVHSGKYYDNVVNYENICEIAALTKGELVTIFVNPVKISSGRIQPDCVQCQAISDSPPESWVKFTAINEASCISNQ